MKRLKMTLDGSNLSSPHDALTLWQPVLNIFGFLFFYYHIMYQILNILEIKCDIKSERLEKSWPLFRQI